MRICGSIVFIVCVVAWAFAAPVSDAEAAYRILNQYLQRFDPEDLQDMYFISDHGSDKRGLGPRPLRFG
ncbi:unnamed protein product [Angiostrongylus costaricensis]|uniref:Uncharacterized protein n=1 Tax=Angiostrongylus costaricensis TaxID=334426 RepID=A0A0R3Q1D5_ANGCS|nr:unnamed protein product [Angiostrongylus costaricensis]